LKKVGVSFQGAPAFDGKPPFQKLLELGYNLPEEFAVFPPVVLDGFSVTWTLEGGNNILSYYTPSP